MSTALEILYQDEVLVVINKPSGLLVHRSEIDRHETRFALQLLRDQLGQKVYPVHRLDKPTSGALAFALSSEMASVITDLWRQRQVEKKYLAIVRGWMPEFIHLDKPMAPPVDKYAKHEKVREEQEAITDFRCLATVEIPVEIDKYPQSRYSLVEASPFTGRKHQIRRHLKHLAHPIIGDARYGKGRHSRYFRDHLNAPRLLLHASELTVPHPLTGENLTVTAPPDAIFRDLMNRFGWSDQLPANVAASLSHDVHPSMNCFLNLTNEDDEEAE
ncbi:pseudouridine synthase [Thalassolituus sp. LLYu03]|uniref:pseudouridine synthase n=1 Tax=Thalassolituus sp. LLYu03 TaxID=3421656 RepID=UPI003D2BCF0E